MRKTVPVRMGDQFVEIPEVFGKYEYVRMIGSGGFSAVALCRHIPTGSPFACKIVSRGLLTEQQIFSRFEQEVRILESLRHPHIVRVENVVFTDTFIFLIMEYCVNGELFDHIVPGRGLAEAQFARIFKQVTEALAFVHSRNIAHRDLKPENILLDRGLNAKLADFGLCHATGVGKLLATPCGSPFYAPPEIIRNVEYDGSKSDVWSLGIVLFTMAAGGLPWTETNQARLFKQIQEAEIDIPRRLSAPVREILGMMLKQDPAKRPTCQQILEMPWVAETDAGPTEPAPGPVNRTGSLALRHQGRNTQSRGPARPRPTSITDHRARRRTGCVGVDRHAREEGPAVRKAPFGEGLVTKCAKRSWHGLPRTGAF